MNRYRGLRPPGQRPRALRERLEAYANLMRWHRPIGALLLLWPALWALWIAARGVPDLYILAIFLLGTWLMRSAGCVINDFTDREFDGRVARTRERPLATGAVSDREAAWLFVALIALAGGLVLTSNQPTILLSIAAVALAVLYPFMKRYTYLPQVYLGAAFGWAVPMAFAAVTGAVSALGWLIFIAVIVWVLVYDTEYAMVDREDDRRIGIKSTAILFDEADRFVIGVFQLLFLLNLLLVGRQAALHWPFGLGVSTAAACFVYQQVLIRRREPARCFAAFINNNWVGMSVFGGIAADFWFYPGSM
ncbi:MAG: 4-hydroxybenzoate octaprenyltransferase [Gammaproteobacteria bacterium]|nr:4-hydroxybenzoate octaprenyltransferase [Gammaproteobacteria bacterium]